MPAISTLQLGWSGLGGFTSLGSPVSQSVTSGVLSTTVRASGSPPGDGIRSAIAYDWIGSELVYELASVGSGQPVVRVGGFGVNNSPAIIHLQNGQVLYGSTDASGEFANLGFTVTSGNYRFGRIRVTADGTAVFFELSNNGTTWTEFWNGLTPPAGMNNCQLQIYGDQTTGSPTYVVNRVNAAATGASALIRPYFFTG